MEPNNPQNMPRQGFTPEPVAYDKDGNPLYAQPQFVHYSRAVQPMEEYVPPEVAKVHDESAKKYPRLNLSKSEYVLSAVRRHPIGLLKIWAFGLILIAAFMAVYVFGFATPDAAGGLQEFSAIALSVLTLMIILTIIGVLVATYVYNDNKFYLTNESVIQEIRSSLFSRNEQTVSLSNIEDASYKQGGILPVILNYGVIRLSTEGDETTYRFSYVYNPKKEIAILNNAVEAFKNGRPVGLPNQDQPS
jgi:hypothetical protein